MTSLTTPYSKKRPRYSLPSASILTPIQTQRIPIPPYSASSLYTREEEKLINRIDVYTSPTQLNSSSAISTSLSTDFLPSSYTSLSTSLAANSLLLERSARHQKENESTQIISMTYAHQDTISALKIQHEEEKRKLSKEAVEANIILNHQLAETKHKLAQAETSISLYQEKEVEQQRVKEEKERQHQERVDSLTLKLSFLYDQETKRREQKESDEKEQALQTALAEERADRERDQARRDAENLAVLRDKERNYEQKRMEQEKHYESKETLLKHQLADRDRQIEQYNKAMTHMEERFTQVKKDMEEYAIIKSQYNKFQLERKDKETAESAPLTVSSIMSRLEEVERENRRLIDEILSLQSKEKNVQLMEEQKIGLERKINRLEEEREKSFALERELKEENQKQNDLIIGIQAFFPNITQLNQLNSQISQIINQNTSYNAQISSLRTQLTDTQTRLTSSLSQQHTLEQQLHTKEDKLIALQQSLNQNEARLIQSKRECDSLNAILKSYDEEEKKMSGEGEGRQLIRIKELEKRIEELKSVEDELAKSKSDLIRLKQENEGLNRQLERTESEAEMMQNKLSRGEYDARTTKIVHLINNPEKEKFTQRKKAELQSIQDENNRLKAQLSVLQSSTSISNNSLQVNTNHSDISSLESQLDDKDKQINRLKEIFASKVGDFKLVIAQLTGWKVDIRNSQEYRCRSIYWNEKQHENDYFLFYRVGEKLKLIENESSKKLEPSIFMIYSHSQSVPALLSTITLSLWKKRKGTDAN